MKWFICDVDGTIALKGSRSPFDYRRVLEDSPNSPVISIVQSLVADGWLPIFVTGREDSCRDDTFEFIKTHVCDNFKLFMRTSGDYRPDDVVKSEIYQRDILPVTSISFVLDDRDKTVKMWRKDHKLTVLQVGEGNF